MVSAKPQVFISYAHEDEVLQQELVKHLQLLERSGLISTWHDRKIGAGNEWSGEIDQHLNGADVILLLISVDFLYSGYCWDVEMKRALQRHRSGEARVIPVILRPVIYERCPFSFLQPLPKDGKPVTSPKDWFSHDAAWVDVAEGICKAIEELRAQRRPHERDDGAYRRSDSKEHEPSVDEANRGKTLVAPAPTIIELTIDRDFDSYSPDELMDAIEEQTGHRFAVNRRRGGSVKLELQLPRDQAEWLDTALKRGDLKHYAVENLEFVGDRYISRPKWESEVLSCLCERQADGSSPRIVTLYGSDGMGKTWLAQACGERLREFFKDGVAVISLAGKGNSQEALCVAIGVQFEMTAAESQPAEVVATLRDKEMVLILDNFEAVACLESVGFLRQLLDQCPNLCLLITSRQPVGLGTTEKLLDLSEGMEAEEAEELFVARARLKIQLSLATPKQGVEPALEKVLDGASKKASAVVRESEVVDINWEPQPDEMNDIKRIVDATKRIPLMIELAAVQADTKTLKEIADGLEHTSSLDLSFDALEDAAKTGFVRLGIFPGSFTVEAAANVCFLPDAQDLLYRLQDCALVRRLGDSEPARYQMHRLTQQFAYKRLCSDDPLFEPIRRRFIAYFGQLVHEKMRWDDSAGVSTKIVQALDWIETELGNIYACTKHLCRDKDWSAVHKLSTALLCFFVKRGHLKDGEALYRELLVMAKESNDRTGEGTLLNALGVLFQFQGCLEEAKQALIESLEMRQGLERAMTLNSLGTIYKDTGALAEAIQCHEKSREICIELQKNRERYTALDERREEAATLSNLGPVYQYLGARTKDPQLMGKALSVMDAALKMWRDELHDAEGEAVVYGNLGLIYQSLADWDYAYLKRAQECFAARLKLLRQLGDVLGQARTLNSLGYMQERQGQLKDATRYFEQAVAACKQVGDWAEAAQTYNRLGLLYQTLAHGDGSYWKLAQESFASRLEILQRLGDIGGQAKTRNSLGYVCECTGQKEEAVGYYQQALTACREVNDWDEEQRTRSNLERMLS